MKIIGITGASGAGKTTVSDILKENESIKIIDCDKVSKNLSMPGNEYLDAIKNEFGTEIILPDGNLNRKLLANYIYSDEEKLEKLNLITFKFVVDEIIKKIDILKKDTNIKIIAIDAPLLFESKLDKLCDYVIALVAKREIKIERICARDNVSKEIAEQRLNIQKDDEFYISKSNFVIENNYDTNLKLEIEKILEKIEG